MSHWFNFGVWVSAGGRTLVMGTNLNHFTTSVTLSEIFLARGPDCQGCKLFIRK